MTHKTKATGGGRQWENTKHKPEHHSDLLAGGQILSGPAITGTTALSRLGCAQLFFTSISQARRNKSPLSLPQRSFFSKHDFKRKATTINKTAQSFQFINFDIFYPYDCRHRSSCYDVINDYSDSLALRRWRYSTSRFNAAVTNCPVLSPGIFTASTLFITSCGTLAATVCDFAFTAFVAMLCTPHKKQMQYAGKKISVQHLTCSTPEFKLVFNTLLAQGAETTKPGSELTLTGLLTTNDRKRIEVAMRNHTTHPQGRDSHNLNKYIWRFIALSTAQPRVITIEATSEQEARQQSPTGCVMVFAARIRQGSHHA
ncbi:TPA: host cell division inhibitor Icd-like protein [Escherichia coli]|nr:host cell division inhibitor Icd-like protein [Escherichia coli]